MSTHTLHSLPSLVLKLIMEAATPSFNENDIRAQLAKAKYDQKWDVLKPVIKKLWMEDDRKLSELMKDIQASYCFTAQSAFRIFHACSANLVSIRIESLSTNITLGNGNGRETSRPRKKRPYVKSVALEQRQVDQHILNTKAKLSTRKNCGVK